MSSLLNYLKQEGLTATFQKAWNKFFHKANSHTVFLRVRLPDEIEKELEKNFELLEESNRAAFEEIKFWDFIHANDFIANEHQSVILLKDKDKYIAYAAEEHEKERAIHGLGSFSLKTGEGWIGPVYVCKPWRGQGNNKRLLLYQMNRLKKIGINTVYTAINSQNIHSLKSFKSVGFEEIGTVIGPRVIGSDPENVLRTAFSNK